jgi:hypothetical protein
MRADDRARDWRTRWAAPPRTAYTSETKPFFLTSEFLVLAAIVLGLAIAMGVLDTFNASRGWLLITIIGAAYMVSRGLAKAGTRDPNPRDGGHD